MKVAVRLLSLSLLAVAIVLPAEARGKKSTSTAPGTYKEWGPDIDQIEIVKTFRFADYKTVVVQPFDTSKVALPEAKDNTYEPVKKVLSSATEGVVQGMRGSVDQKVSISEKNDKTPGTLIIRGKVTVLDPGSRAARYWAGFGAGAAKAEIQCEIVDAETGEVLARFTQQRRSGVGMAGGDYQELLQRSLNQIGEDVAAMLKAF